MSFVRHTVRRRRGREDVVEEWVGGIDVGDSNSRADEFTENLGGCEER